MQTLVLIGQLSDRRNILALLAKELIQRNFEVMKKENEENQLNVIDTINQRRDADSKNQLDLTDETDQPKKSKAGPYKQFFVYGTKENEIQKIYFQYHDAKFEIDVGCEFTDDKFIEQHKNCHFVMCTPNKEAIKSVEERHDLLAKHPDIETKTVRFINVEGVSLLDNVLLFPQLSTLTPQPRRKEDEQQATNECPDNRQTFDSTAVEVSNKGTMDFHGTRSCSVPFFQQKTRIRTTGSIDSENPFINNRSRVRDEIRSIGPLFEIPKTPIHSPKQSPKLKPTSKPLMPGLSHSAPAKRTI